MTHVSPPEAATVYFSPKAPGVYFALECEDCGYMTDYTRWEYAYEAFAYHCKQNTRT